MKRWVPLLVPMLACMAMLSAETLQEVYARGMRAAMAGDNAAARQSFLQLLAADPTNKAAAAKGDLKSRADSMMRR